MSAADAAAAQRRAQANGHGLPIRPGLTYEALASAIAAEKQPIAPPTQ